MNSDPAAVSTRRLAQGPEQRRGAVAVVTGGHSYDVPNFHRLFRSLDGVDAYIQHIDDFAASSDETRRSYDAVVFYFFPVKPAVPTDEGQAWFQGKPKTALEALGATKQGIVVLHHAILAYPEWDVWNRITGIEDRAFTYHFDQSVHVDVANTTHPITRGMTPWDMIDETYGMKGAGEDSDVLLTCNHPKNLPTVAWTRTHGLSRVFCLQSGHDNQCWQNPNFREVLRRGILWSAGK
jgi:hypothetical protein